MKNSNYALILLAALAILAVAPPAHGAEPLGSSEQFGVDQVNRSLDNVAKDLERIEAADRDDAAALALKGANRNLAQARERMQQFLSRHPGLDSHPDVETTQARLQRLAASVAGTGPGASQAEPAAKPAERAALTANEAASRTESAAKASGAGATRSPELSRKQQFDLQQIETTLNNAVQRLDAYRDAERDDVAALALKGAKRGRDEASEKLAAFIDAHPDAGEVPQIAAVRERVEALGAAIEQAESDAQAASATAASAGADATTEAERILALRNEHADAIGAIHGRSVVYSDSADGTREAVAVIEAAERAAERIRPVLLAFRERFGSDEESVTQALDAAGAEASSSNSRVAYNAAGLHQFLEKLGDTRAVSAETVAEHVTGRLADIDDYSANIQQQRLAEAAEMVRIGQRIDPANPRLNRLRGEVAQLARAKRDEQMARVASATWPGHADDFDGPGTVDALSDSVHQYLANDRDWGKSDERPQDVLSVAVTGNWQVADRDLFGQPIRWRLPVMVAITDDELKPDGVAQAFELSMVAREGAPNDAPKSPPWDGFWVGDNYYLRIGELP